MPQARSFSRAAGLIQSVLQAGASCVTMRACRPAAVSAARRSDSICSMAGQPLAGGVMTTSGTPSVPGAPGAARPIRSG